MASQYAPRPQTPASLAATRVASDIHSDSGYGGSVSDGENILPATILNPAQHDEHERRQWASHLHQLAYNQNRVALGRSINRTVETLKEFQKMNNKWPIHYPSVERPEAPGAMQRSRSSIDEWNDLPGPSNRPQLTRRAATSLQEVTQPTGDEPRLVTPQIAEDLNVLKLDLRFGALSPGELVHSLGKSSIASLLDEKISQTAKHLLALRSRIEDTTSKVLVTGDVNAGKSTFCNALMRRRILPEDQQPCTSAFCEVLDARENSNVEEVHAIKEGVEYDHLDESTYDVYPLDQLEDIVVDNDDYRQAKVYVDDVRPVETSFLRNGVVDISLIDAPGLNTDSVKTTSVFARQEEIDVVVYVVAAENHFTMSGTNFIENAAKEKAYIFIVVNRFDNIRAKGKEKCQKAILDQIATLSPQTYRDAHELVHFVSSNAVVDGKDATKLKEFEDLEQDLRSFVLDKRARSKLAPAKTYLLNLLNDIETLARVNRECAASELEKINRELESIAPAFEKLVKVRQEVVDNCDKTIEETAVDVYKYSRNTIFGTISHLDDKPVVTYAGILDAFNYAEATKQTMLDRVQASVTESENYARTKTTTSVSSISALGMSHLGDEYVHRAFRPEFMFARKRDQLSKQITIELDITDFFELDFQAQEKQIAGAGMSLTLATVGVSQLFGGRSWVDSLWKVGNVIGFRNAKKLVLPALVLAVIGTSYYFLSDLPRAVPRKLARKIRKQFVDLDYVHANAERIAQQCRKVLKFPSEDLRSGFQRGIEKQGKAVKDRKEIKKENEGADKYFGNLLGDAKQQRQAISMLDLEPQHSQLEAAQEEQQPMQAQQQEELPPVTTLDDNSFADL